MAKNNFKDVMPIILIAGLGIGGYFLWKYFKKEEPKEGFIRVSSPIPGEAVKGETLSITVVGKNNTNETHLCFTQIVDQETMELLTPMQSEQVVSGLSKQFTFVFTMPNKLLRLEIQTGRIINNEKIIDSRYPKTIQMIPGEVSAIIDNLQVIVS